MPNLFNDNRLSDYVGGIVDRKIKAIAMSITSSTGYFKSLISQALIYTNSAQGSAVSAQSSANQASNDATLTALIWNKFTSQYLGQPANDPAVSSIGNPITNGAFYIRSTDKRLRVATVNAQGVLRWDDAQVSADKATVIAAGTGEFLSVKGESDQSVKSAVSFVKAITIPKVTDWNSTQAVTAKDVTDKLTAVDEKFVQETNRANAADVALSNAINQETQRAVNSENALVNSIAGANQALTNLANSFSSGSDGTSHWRRDKDGIIEQWGYIQMPTGSNVVRQTIVFPIAFTTECESITGNSSGPPSNNRNSITVIFPSVTQTSASVTMDTTSTDNSFTISNRLYWRAIGR